MKSVKIAIKQENTLSNFLESNGFTVEELGNDIYRVQRDEELPVFLKISDEQIYFEVDLGNISSIAGENLYFNLLDLNTEILPVSFGINNCNAADPRLVLVESRESGDLCANELLSVFDALELAIDKAEKLLSQNI